jgi:hypothetical protein
MVVARSNACGQKTEGDIVLRWLLVAGVVAAAAVVVYVAASGGRLRRHGWRNSDQ